jgi:hypothetical protein
MVRDATVYICMSRSFYGIKILWNAFELTAASGGSSKPAFQRPTAFSSSGF